MLKVLCKAFLCIFTMIIVVNKINGEEICSKSLITVRWHNGTVLKCSRCPVCRRGWGTTYSCGDVIYAPLTKPIQCMKCERRQTFSVRRSNDKCQTCKQCQANREIVKKCTRSANRRCGGCKKGSYLDKQNPHFSTCEKCSTCCGNDKDERIKECESQGLSRNLQCRYLRGRNCNSSSAMSTSQISVKTVPMSETSARTNSDQTATGWDGLTSPRPVVNGEENSHNVTSKPMLQRDRINVDINNNTVNSVWPGLVVTVVLLILAGLVYYFYKNRNPNLNQRTDQSAKQESTSEGSSNSDSEPTSLDALVAGVDDESQTDAQRQEQQKDIAARSSPVKDFIEDTKDCSRYDDFCHLMNTKANKQNQEDFQSLSRSLDIKYDTMWYLREDPGGGAQALLNQLNASKGSLATLEQLARKLDDLGRKREAAMLRSEDQRLQLYEVA